MVSCAHNLKTAMVADRLTLPYKVLLAGEWDCADARLKKAFDQAINSIVR